MADIHGYQTAISRSTPPEPLRWLHSHGKLVGRTLDYGSGRQCWYGMECYDPYWKPVKPSGKFDTIVCNYVLNVVPESVQDDIIKDIRGMLKEGGTAYITVRRDLPRSGQAGRGTFQRYVELSLPSISKTATREIYSTGGNPMNRSAISRRTWRARKAEGGKGTCHYCFQGVFSGGSFSHGKLHHKTCLIMEQAGVPKSLAVRNPGVEWHDKEYQKSVDRLNAYRKAGATLKAAEEEGYADASFYSRAISRKLGIPNPRPPAGWWAKMKARVAAMPKYAHRSAKSLNRIVAGIWWGFPEKTRRKLVAKYDNPVATTKTHSSDFRPSYALANPDPAWWKKATKQNPNMIGGIMKKNPRKNVKARRNPQFNMGTIITVAGIAALAYGAYWLYNKYGKQVVS